MAIDRSCGNACTSIADWLDKHPFLRGTLVCLGAAVVAAGAVALLIWAGAADSDSSSTEPGG